MSMFWVLGATSRAMSASVKATNASEKATDAKADARDAARDVAELQVRLERTLLACEAMWSLLRDKLGVTDDQLAERINDIDLSDGQLDGKVRRTPMTCPKCSRTISRRLPSCMYCGQPIVHDPFA